MAPWALWPDGIAAQLGEREQAMEELNAALRQGQQFDLTFHRNPFLYPLHGYEPFEEFLRPKDDFDQSSSR